jgi:putative component of membrane protein insertase Oxa1/YidC/SpoIIIJ protein YidD
MISEPSTTIYDHIPSQDDLYSDYYRTLIRTGEMQKITRPCVQWNKAGIYMGIPAMICLGLFCVGKIGGINPLCWFTILAFGFYVIFCAKQILIFSITVYQRYAPTRVRMSCLFEPSCSEYMRLAIEKYGLRKGFAKGIGRIRRCKPPNGGVDWP